MALTYRIDAPAGLIHITSRDRLSGIEMEQVADSLLKDPEFRPGLDVLSDCRELSVAPSTDEARVAAELIQRVGSAGIGRVAIVATSAVIYGMSQMIGGLAGLRGYEVEVFSSTEDALAWLAEPPAVRTKRKPRGSGGHRRPPS